MGADTDLDRLEQELDDVETVLACISSDRRDVCDVCRAARSDHTITDRPALAACAATRFPREVPML